MNLLISVIIAALVILVIAVWLSTPARISLCRLLMPKGWHVAKNPRKGGEK